MISEQQHGDHQESVTKLQRKDMFGLIETTNVKTFRNTEQKKQNPALQRNVKALLQA